MQTDGKKIWPKGTGKRVYTKAQRAVDSDDLVTLGQLQDNLSGEVVTDVGSFSIDPDNAIALQTPQGLKYIALAVRS